MFTVRVTHSLSGALADADIVAPRKADFKWHSTAGTGAEGRCSAASEASRGCFFSFSRAPSRDEEGFRNARVPVINPFAKPKAKGN